MKFNNKSNKGPELNQEAKLPEEDTNANWVLKSSNLELTASKNLAEESLMILAPAASISLAMTSLVGVWISGKAPVLTPSNLASNSRILALFDIFVA